MLIGIYKLFSEHQLFKMKLAGCTRKHMLEKTRSSDFLSFFHSFFYPLFESYSNGIYRIYRTRNISVSNPVIFTNETLKGIYVPLPIKIN